MKKVASVIVLLFLPLIFSLFLQSYKNSLGEYYLGRNYDPSYPYLINSLNLSQFKAYGVGLIAHPGTPVQEVGAVVILIVHSFQSGNHDIVRDVLNNPEHYLNKIFESFLLLNSIAIYLLGITVYRRMKSLTAALFLQLTPFAFFSEDIFFQLTNVSVEPILVFTILLLITVIMTYINKNGSGKNLLFYSIIFGVLCGLGMATKISFFPVMVIPFLVIRQIKFKALFILVSILAFLVFVYPAFSSENADGFLVWVRDLLTHSGKYGRGNEDYVDAFSYFENIKIIFSKNLIFSISYILLWMTFILQFFKKYKTHIRENKYFNLLTGILIAMTIQILIVAKHFSLYYMIPAFMLSILGLFIVNSIVLSYYPEFLRNKFKSVSYFAVVTFLIIVSFYFYVRSIKQGISLTRSSRNESRQIIRSLDKEYKNTIVISSYQCSSKEFALYLGCVFGGTQTDRYMNVLREMYPNDFYYNRWDNNFYNVWDSNFIKSQLYKANSFIFQGATEEEVIKFMNKVREMTNKPAATYRKISSNVSGETLYEITLE